MSMKFFSKMLDTKHDQAFTQFGITPEKFETQSEIEIYNYIKEHISRNGETPSPEEVAAKFEEFVYTPTTSSFDVLTQEINDRYASCELLRLIQGKSNVEDIHEKQENLSSLLNKRTGQELIKFMQEKLEEIKLRTASNVKVGLSIKDDFDWFLDEYERRKEGKSFKVWKSRFPSLNEIMGGGYVAGNMYVIYGRSGRGKSIFSLEEAIEAAWNGANVIYYGLEMPYVELYARAYSSISARKGIFHKTIEGIDYTVGFPQKDIVMGKMSDEYYQQFKKFVSEMNKILPGNIIFKAVDEKTWFDKSLNQIESDVIQANADYIVIDPAYLLDMEKNTSKTKGGDLARTSIKMRLLAGQLGIVILTVTQAGETKEEEDEDGNRELQVPERSELAKSKQLLQDASLTIGIDTVGQRGMLVPRKGRSGGEGEKIEVTFLPNYGIVQELVDQQKANDYFDQEDPTAIF